MSTAREPPPLLSLGRQAWLALFLSFLLLRSTAGAFWTPENRYFFQWQRSDAVAVLLAHVGVALPLLVLSQLAARTGALGRRARDVVFLSLAAFFLKVNFAEALHSPVAEKALLVVALGCVGLFVLRPAPTLRGVRATCLAFSPILLIYGLTLAGAASYPVSATPRQGRAASPVPRGMPRIYVAVFDEWSYARTFADRRPLADYPGLRRLAGRAVVFHQARSPARNTVPSIPGLLLGLDEPRFEVRDDGLWIGVDPGEALRPARELPNAFQRFGALGYRTGMIGNFIPYPDILGAAPDLCESRDIYKLFGTGRWAVARSMLLESASIRLGGLLPWVRAAYRRAKSSFFLDLVEWTHARALSDIRSGEVGFGVYHYPVPHAPFVFDRAGLRGPEASSATTLDAYAGNLRFTDRLLDELLAGVEESPAGSAILVVTSDHALRSDSDRNGASPEDADPRHVPVLVSFPGSPRRADVTAPFPTARLLSALADAVSSGGGQDAFLEACLGGAAGR